ncbi:WAP four-disulfide core domain protein 6A-like isoform X1 [Camelus ferus]|uniref:WAP four-disulfide core domain protein 6A-like isoform X1 n=1 Tax=Camelus ferus TaxID=419612 RepID=A0A8B8RGQ4_CAMFR|nr:WAP four-disulfide core domain protein 6A-like isoform X1 [Camelus ferus]
MGFSGLLPILVPFILLEGVQEPGLVEAFHSACPKNRVKCAIEERNQCVKNRECPENMKCCRFGCARQCLNPKQDVCILPKEPGRCLAYLPRWWYDAQNKVCSQFIYGGCQGNSNNFQSQAVCQAICPKRSKSQGLQSPTLTWAALGGLGVVWSIPETQQAWDGQNQSNQESHLASWDKESWNNLQGLAHHPGISPGVPD